MKTLRTIILFAAFISAAPYVASAQTADEYTRKGVEYADKKMYDEALEMFRKAAAAQDSSSAKAFHNRGWVMELQGNIPAALENYKEAIRRNPTIADPYERVGYWYYRAGKYADAVQMGEKALKLDPANQEVKAWLPDAFRQKMEKPAAPAESDILQQKPSPTAVKAEEKKTEELIAAPLQRPDAEKLPEEAMPTRMYVSFDTTFRPGYNYRKGSFKYYTTEGAVANAPYTVEMWFKPIPKSESRFSFSAGNPYLGAVMPQMINQYEKTEAVFSLGPIGAGAGMMLNHYKNNLFFDKTLFLTDVKLGGILEFKNKESAFSLSAYPRAIPYMYDTSKSTGKTLDVQTAELKYIYFLDESVSYYSRLAEMDTYIFDNEAKISNYWGYYEVAVGLTMGNKGAVMGKDISATIEIGKKVYLKRLDNTKPYKWFNGQGFLGIDTGKTDGTYFSGYHSTSNLFMFKTEEGILPNLSLFQRMLIEFADRHNDHNEFSIQLGVGGKF